VDDGRGGEAQGSSSSSRLRLGSRHLPPRASGLRLGCGSPTVVLLLASAQGASEPQVAGGGRALGDRWRQGVLWPWVYVEATIAWNR
jgi:hypothetical protein